MIERNLHIAIVGAGLGGLCLAQGLRKLGISFAVYERDGAADSRTQGYRIRIDATGQRALTACLPADLDLLFRQTCAISRAGGQFLDTQLRPIAGRPPASWRPSALAGRDAEQAGDQSANRQTLREILLSGIEDRVHFGKDFQHFEERPDGKVTVRFGNGRWCEADLLVAADGANSSVCRQRFPFDGPQDTGATCIYGKTFHGFGSAVADALMSGTSVIFAEDFAVIVDAMCFRFPEGRATPSPVQDYLYWAVIGPREVLGLGGGAASQQPDGAALLALLKRLATPWAGGLRALFAGADRSTIAALPIRSAASLSPWTASRVTALGDAIHAMSPAGGVGANTALEDAACLTRQLARIAADPSSLPQMIAAYEADMRQRANAAIEASTLGARSLFREAAAS